MALCCRTEIRLPLSHISVGKLQITRTWLLTCKVCFFFFFLYPLSISPLPCSVLASSSFPTVSLLQQQKLKFLCPIGLNSRNLNYCKIARYFFSRRKEEKKLLFPLLFPPLWPPYQSSLSFLLFLH